MRLPIWVGQFNIVDGEVREEGPYTAFFPASGGDHCDLGVVSEAVIPDSTFICQELVASLGRHFQHWQLSVTGGLLRALQEVHSHLLNWNRHSLPEHRLAVGMSCVAHREQEAYLAQAGPSLAYWWQGGSLVRLQPEEEATDPLGMAEGLRPTLHRCELAPGHRLLLVTSTVASLSLERQLAETLSLDPQAALAALYRLAQPLRDSAALLIAT